MEERRKKRRGRGEDKGKKGEKERGREEEKKGMKERKREGGKEEGGREGRKLYIACFLKLCCS